MRRDSVLSPDAPEICPACNEPYDYAVVSAAAALNEDQWSGLLIRSLDTFLTAPRVLQRTFIGGLLLAVLTLSIPWTIAASGLLRTLLMEPQSVAQQFISISNTVVSSILTADSRSLVHLASTFWTFFLKASDWRQGRDIFLRFLTSRQFWQQYPLWSSFLQLPLLLHILLLKVAIESFCSFLIYAEQGALSSLVQWEGTLIEKLLARYVAKQAGVPLRIEKDMYTDRLFVK
jgi:hypothetical protein